MIADEFLVHDANGRLIGSMGLSCEGINPNRWFAHLYPDIAGLAELSVGPYDSGKKAAAAIKERARGYEAHLVKCPACKGNGCYEEYGQVFGCKHCRNGVVEVLVKTVGGYEHAR